MTLIVIERYLAQYDVLCWEDVYKTRNELSLQFEESLKKPSLRPLLSMYL